MQQVQRVHRPHERFVLVGQHQPMAEQFLEHIAWTVESQWTPVLLCSKWLMCSKYLNPRLCTRSR